MSRDDKDGFDAEMTGQRRYDEELLSANWNPVIDLLEWSCARTGAQAAREEPHAVREEDVADFLGRIYRLGN